MSSDTVQPGGAGPPAASPRRRFVLAVALLGLLVALCAPFFVDPVAHDAPRARDGVVSFARWGPLTAPVELKGDWKLVWRTAPAAGANLTVPVPGDWAGDYPGGVRLPALGAASYQLRVRDLPAGRYTLYAGQAFSASRVVVNGRTLSESGVLGLTAATTRALHRAQEVTFDSDGSDIDLRIDIANFHHHDNGLKRSPVFGLSDGMSRWIGLDWLKSLLLVTAILVLASYGLVVFLFRPRERASVWFGIACVLLLPFAATVAHDDLIALAAPGLSLNALLTVQYLTSAAAVAVALAYVRELYPQETPALPYWLLQAGNGLRIAIYVGVGLAGDTVLLSHISQLASAYRIVAFAFMLAVVVFACVRRRTGAFIFLFGLGSFVLALIYNDLVGNLHLPAVFGESLVPMASLLLLFSQLLVLAERWSTAIDSSERTNMDLRRLLDVNISISSEMQLGTLLKKIVKVTTAVIHADRSSLFLHDERTGELAAVVAEGVHEGELRFPSTEGLAGWAFTHGETLNLPDAYEDPRFNREVDAVTGYRTRSVLTVPVTTRDGRRVGVMQALNHQDRSSFGENEVERMSAFAAQAAIAIENATLFTEVASERNYNESILRSMSSGVITLDRDARVAKLNDAACAILRIAPGSADGADARLLLSGTNAWLMDEITAVSASGRPKTLLDADVRTVSGETVSANVSIVPLRTEGEQAGLLIIVEDISEGKRLQGAMPVHDPERGRSDHGAGGRAAVRLGLQRVRPVRRYPRLHDAR